LNVLAGLVLKKMALFRLFGVLDRMILFLVVFCMIVALGFSLASAWSDFRTMTIPNIYIIGIGVSFLPAFLLDLFAVPGGPVLFSSWLSHLVAAGLVFLVTILFFAARIIGAGDSKMCAALALWAGLGGLAPFLFYMALTGAVLALATKLMAKKQLFRQAPEGSWIAKAQAGGAGVPYGIALFIGAIVAFYQLGYFAPEKLALLAGYTEISG